MRFEASIELLLVHRQGGTGKVAVAGSLRRFLTREPRAHVAQSVNLLLAPTRR
jgi:proline racemase